MPSTDSFTGTALATSTGTVGTLTYNVADGQYNERGFYCKIDPTGVTVTKAATFGGSQAALTFPISRTDAVSLAALLYQVAN